MLGVQSLPTLPFATTNSFLKGPSSRQIFKESVQKHKENSVDMLMWLSSDRAMAESYSNQQIIDVIIKQLNTESSEVSRVITDMPGLKDGKTDADLQQNHTAYQTRLTKLTKYSAGRTEQVNLNTTKILGAIYEAVQNVKFANLLASKKTTQNTPEVVIVEEAPDEDEFPIFNKIDATITRQMNALNEKDIVEAISSIDTKNDYALQQWKPTILETIQKLQTQKENILFTTIALSDPMQAILTPLNMEHDFFTNINTLETKLNLISANYTLIAQATKNLMDTALQSLPEPENKLALFTSNPRFTQEVNNKIAENVGEYQQITDRGSQLFQQLVNQIKQQNLLKLKSTPEFDSQFEINQDLDTMNEIVDEIIQVDATMSAVQQEIHDADEDVEIAQRVTKKRRREGAEGLMTAAQLKEGYESLNAIKAETGNLKTNFKKMNTELKQDINNSVKEFNRVESSLNSHIEKLESERKSTIDEIQKIGAASDAAIQQRLAEIVRYEHQQKQAFGQSMINTLAESHQGMTENMQNIQNQTNAITNQQVQIQEEHTKHLNQMSADILKLFSMIQKDAVNIAQTLGSGINQSTKFLAENQTAIGNMIVKSTNAIQSDIKTLKTDFNASITNQKVILDQINAYGAQTASNVLVTNELQNKLIQNAQQQSEIRQTLTSIQSQLINLNTIQPKESTEVRNGEEETRLRQELVNEKQKAINIKTNLENELKKLQDDAQIKRVEIENLNMTQNNNEKDISMLRLKVSELEVEKKQLANHQQSLTTMVESLEKIQKDVQTFHTQNMTVSQINTYLDRYKQSTESSLRALLEEYEMKRQNIQSPTIIHHLESPSPQVQSTFNNLEMVKIEKMIQASFTAIDQANNALRQTTILELNTRYAQSIADVDKKYTTTIEQIGQHLNLMNKIPLMEQNIGTILTKLAGLIPTRQLASIETDAKNAKANTEILIKQVAENQTLLKSLVDLIKTRSPEKEYNKIIVETQVQPQENIVAILKAEIEKIQKSQNDVTTLIKELKKPQPENFVTPPTFTLQDIVDEYEKAQKATITKLDDQYKATIAAQALNIANLTEQITTNNKLITLLQRTCESKPPTIIQNTMTQPSNCDTQSIINGVTNNLKPLIQTIQGQKRGRENLEINNDSNRNCKFKTTSGTGIKKTGWKRCMNPNSLDALEIQY